jgi:predicted amidohydrolase/predicted N-acetyltransferase YhbS
MNDKAHNSKARLVVRPAALSDIDQIAALSKRVFGDLSSSRANIRGHLNHFAQGQFVVEYEGEIVGYCATCRIAEDIALAPHSWDEITGHGFASRHDPKGDMLYGIEVAVDPSVRNKRIGQRLYNARKELCQRLGLKGIVFGGRIPGFKRWHQRSKQDAEAYLDAVINKTQRDPVVNFQLKNDFEFQAVLADYLPEDAASMGYAALMRWYNPEIIDPSHAIPDSYTVESRGQDRDTVRVATVQYMMRRISGPDEFEQQVHYFIETAADYSSDFVCFPELFTLQLLSANNETMRPEEAIRAINDYTPRFVKFMSEQAMRYNINIIGGSHPSIDEDANLRNISHVFLRDGSIHAQHKLHPTPNERHWWHIGGGNRAEVIPTDCGPIGVMICYDSEFPEVARHLVNQGANILFVPFCTDERQGYLRVRYCSQARAVENQCYVVTSGVVGNLPNVENMDMHYAESAIFTPCDFPFARDGIAAMCDTNTETMAVADLRMGELVSARNSGTVQNLKDRRFDLYRLSWRKR